MKLKVLTCSILMAKRYPAEDKAKKPKKAWDVTRSGAIITSGNTETTTFKGALKQNTTQ